MPGTLTIRPLKANLRHDKDLFSRMDPYVEFLLGGQKTRTGVCYEGGRHPHWSSVLTLQSNNEPTLFVTLKDKDTFSHDDYIGNCQIDLRSLTSYPKGPQWYPVMGKNGSSEGEILIEISFNPSVQTYAQPYVQPSPVYGGYPVQQQVQPAYTVPQQTVAYPTQPMPGYPMGQPTMAYQQPQPMMTQPAYQPSVVYPMTTQPTVGVAYTQPTVIQPQQGYAPMGGYGGHGVYRYY